MSDDDVIEVVIEIPRGSRNKYEFDHERHVMRLDRRLFSATVYPLPLAWTAANRKISPWRM